MNGGSISVHMSLGKTLNSSIGAKALMAVTGIIEDSGGIITLQLEEEQTVQVK